MTGHFVTACGCERYRTVEYPITSRLYKLPTMRKVLRDESRPFSTPCNEVSFRLFELKSLDMAHGLAEYREVLQ